MRAKNIPAQPTPGLLFAQSTPRYGTPLRAAIALLLAVVMLFSGSSLALAAQPEAAPVTAAAPAESLAAAPDPTLGCNYANSGTGAYADSLCWFDFSSLDPEQAKSDAGQTISIVVAGGNTFTATFHLQGQDVKPVAFPTYAGAYLGNRGFYTGVAGKPALYQQQKALPSTLTLSDISLVSPQGTELDNFALVGADAEASDNRESLSWSSDVPISRLPLNPLGNACGGGFTGEGTPEVTCIGRSESGQQKTGTPMVSANNPSWFAQTLISRGMQGVAFGVLVSSVSLKKNVVFPIAGDNFQITTSSEEVQLGAAETGMSGTSASTGRNTYVTSVGNAHNTVTFAESALTGSLNNYTTTWACTNNGTPIDVPAATVLDDATKRGFALPVGVGDALDCTITNTGPEQPALSITKSADLDLITAAGQTVTYLFRVTNTGNVTIKNVAPAETAFSGTGTLGSITPASATLQPGESRTFTATYVTTQADVDAVSHSNAMITNTAVATGTSVYSNTPVTSNESTVTIPEQQTPALTIVKSADLAQVTAANQTVTYTFVVKNTGNVTIERATPVETSFNGDGGNGTMSDITPGPVTLQPGESQAFTATYLTTQADVDAQQTTGLTNTAKATGTVVGNGSPVESDPSTVEIPQTKQPKLDVKKTANVTLITKAGQQISYTFDVQNTGNVTILGAKPVEVANGFSGHGTLGEITPAAADLTPGQSQRFTASYVTTQADVEAASITNVATATGGVPGSDDPVVSPPSEVEIPTAQLPGLAITKTASVNSTDGTHITAAGQLVRYTFEVENTGNLTLTDVQPAEQQFSGTGTLSAIATTTGQRAVTLAPGEKATFVASYEVTQADLNAGSVSNTATATGTPPGTSTPIGSNESEAKVPVAQNPALQVTKQANTTLISAVGQTVTYTFTVTNTGNVTITGVKPVEGTFTGTGQLGEIATAAGAATVTLAPGEQAEFFAKYTTTQADLNAGGVRNTATATGTPPEGTTLPPVGPSTVQLPTNPVAAAALALTGSPGALGGTVAAGLLLLLSGAALVVRQRRRSARA